MESRLFETDLLTGHEPENRKSLEINEAILRFMERSVFHILDTYWDHERGGGSSARAASGDWSLAILGVPEGLRR